MRAVGGEGEEESGDQGGGQGRAAVRLFLNDGGKDQGEGNDGNACELIDGKSGVAERR